MGKVYNIVILSNLTATTAGQASDCLCYFDWSLLPQSRWKCRLTASLGVTGFGSNQACQVFIDLGQMNNEMGRNQNGYYNGSSKYNSQYVGTIMETNQGANSSFFCAATKNPPIYLNQTPTNNSFKLNLVNHGSGQGLFVPNTNLSMFVLSMEMLDDPIPRSVKNMYNVVFNSENGTSTLSNSNFVNYKFDWGCLPKGRYQVNTTLMTSDILYNFFPIISIYCDLGQANKTVYYVSNSSGGRAASSNFVAMLFPTGSNLNGSGSAGGLYSYNDQNQGIYLENRPTNNDVAVYVRTSYPTGLLADLTDINYTLVFNFQWLGE